MGHLKTSEERRENVVAGLTWRSNKSRAIFTSKPDGSKKFGPVTHHRDADPAAPLRALCPRVGKTREKRNHVVHQELGLFYMGSAVRGVQAAFQCAHGILWVPPGEGSCTWGSRCNHCTWCDTHPIQALDIFWCPRMRPARGSGRRESPEVTALMWGCGCNPRCRKQCQWLSPAPLNCHE